MPLCHISNVTVIMLTLSWYSHPANIKHLYIICTMLDQRRRRWADVVQNFMLYKCFCVCLATAEFKNDKTFWFNHCRQLAMPHSSMEWLNEWMINYMIKKQKMGYERDNFRRITGLTVMYNFNNPALSMSAARFKMEWRPIRCALGLATKTGNNDAFHKWDPNQDKLMADCITGFKFESMKSICVSSLHYCFSQD